MTCFELRIDVGIDPTISYEAIITNRDQRESFSSKEFMHYLLFPHGSNLTKEEYLSHVRRHQRRIVDTIFDDEADDIDFVTKVIRIRSSPVYKSMIYRQDQIIIDVNPSKSDEFSTILQNRLVQYISFLLCYFVLFSFTHTINDDYFLQLDPIMQLIAILIQPKLQRILQSSVIL